MLKAATLLLRAAVAYSAAAPRGIDINGFQKGVNWASVKSHGVEFVYIQKTGGTTFRNPAFASQYIGATNASLLRGAYHLASPNTSSGVAQADFFLEQEGGWTADGKTLPGALALEGRSGAPRCYGLSQTDMVMWIRDFSNTYRMKTGRYPVIYTSTEWWATCTGNSAAFGSTNPLWIALYSTTPGPLPNGWKFHTLWQYASSGPDPGAQDRFNGDSAGLRRLADGM